MIVRRPVMNNAANITMLIILTECQKIQDWHDLILCLTVLSVLSWASINKAVIRLGLHWSLITDYYPQIYYHPTQVRLGRGESTPQLSSFLFSPWAIQTKLFFNDFNYLIYHIHLECIFDTDCCENCSLPPLLSNYFRSGLKN